MNNGQHLATGEDKFELNDSTLVIDNGDASYVAPQHNYSGEGHALIKTGSELILAEDDNLDNLRKEEEEQEYQLKSEDELPLDVLEGDEEAIVVPAPVTPLPKGAIFAISIIFICEGFAYTFLFPFLGFMIVDFGLVKDEKDAGYYAGFLAGSFALTQFFSGFLYGVLADRFSKRLVVLISTIGCMITIIIFGMSPNFMFAVVVRGLNGGLNGLTATAKAYLSDVTDRTNQSLAFSFLGLAWGIGAISGPSIGGFFAHPAKKYPSIFGNMTLFKKFPYLFPCIVCCVVMMFGFVCCAVFMTPPKKKVVNNSTTMASDEEDEGGNQQDIPLKESTSMTELDTTEPSVSDESSFQHSLHQIQEPIEVKYDQGSWVKRVWRSVKLEGREIVRILCNKEVALASSIYFLCSTIDTMQEELWGLWAMIDRSKGGLSFSTIQIGIAQMMIGSMLLVQPIIFPFCAKLFGKLNCLRIGFLLIIPLLFTPQLNLFTHSKPLLWTALTLQSMLRAFTGMLTFTAVFIIINNAAPSGTAGRVMALSNSAGCIARVVAPLIAGPLLALSAQLATRYSSVLINIPFVAFAILSLLAVILSLPFNSSINEPKDDTTGTDSKAKSN